MSFELLLTEYMDVYEQSIANGITGTMVRSDRDYQIKCTFPTTATQSHLSQFTEHSELFRNKTVLVIGYLESYDSIKPGNEVEVNNVRYSILTPPAEAKLLGKIHSVVLVAI